MIIKLGKKLTRRARGLCAILSWLAQGSCSEEVVPFGQELVMCLEGEGHSRKRELRTQRQESHQAGVE